MAQTRKMQPDEIMKLKLLNELAALGNVPVVASRCRSLQGLPKNVIEALCQRLAQEDLITCEIKRFIGHREAIIQTTPEGLRYLDRAPNQG